LNGKSRDHWLRYLVHAVALIPAGYLLWQIAADQFLFDAIKEVTIRTGRLAITFLMLSLACTPVYIVLGLRKALEVRRELGLYASGYALVHFLTFAIWDYGMALPLIWQAVAYQRYIVPGGVALVILLILALTSWPRLRTRLGKHWRALQKGAYLAGVLVVLHVMWAAKNPLERLNYGLILIGLYLVRLPPVRRALVRARKGIAARFRGISERPT